MAKSNGRWLQAINIEPGMTNFFVLCRYLILKVAKVERNNDLRIDV